MKLLFGNKKDDLLSRLKRQEPAAQKVFYDQNVKKFLSISRSYVTDLYQAEDCVIKAFCKIFKSIETFRNDGSFEGWARRIVVNECLNFIKSHKTVFYLDDISQSYLEEIYEEDVTFDFNAQELLDQLPDAYRMVFNLYVLEDYSHQEIADTLQISVAVSKTQLFRAKEKMRKIYFQQQKALKNEHY
ncbi:RNA polymerase sigma factor [Chryseobacterium gambrini]|uniref:RNA polymerase sigma factor n=1 Tax=Chryseobacterium gambrini TaxID=373672 RepID=A0AAJ1R3C6_9FLAO|nr:MULTISPECIES: RNA polymerase sigma factor [Chryseobacterium]MDN4012310.1 RNA polymerase sigma factor [Chryseobacterium gambrini]MDN4030520.1 RNA polymerase sigma factor [Chryseobacterium gambrini]QWA36821.1 RNA polymerase sigma factor [Chryseobacterium sp. ZHDP1]